MTDNITLHRAVVEQVREAFKELDYASEPEVNEIARTALAALDAALAEPPATREPATVEQVIEANGPPWGPSASPAFFSGWRAAERHHGIITKEDKP
jgi:hypothetical protein